ncbi:hypothetical protein P280DRAFT_518867 [Massarina eburnea CBS 473.64]|uniref:Mid2 domain-containing protein n=1 Tax=Massarina eburnea CBS 473.64 TaxID=1395130 RepID=A0A6A6RZQ2_9PLEO|nr:hypothetical protein P280DRAFT_518867 [Massarina eburnea CBS 473.64]
MSPISIFTIAIFIATALASENLESTTVDSPTVDSPQDSTVLPPFATSFADTPSSSPNSSGQAGSILAACIVSIIVGVAVVGIFVTCAMRGFRLRRGAEENQDAEATGERKRSDDDKRWIDTPEPKAIEPVIELIRMIMALWKLAHSATLPLLPFL